MRKQEFLSTYSGKLIIINIIAFILFSILSIIIGIEKSASWFYLRPANIFIKHDFWTIFTSMFMHANFTHLLVNMISLSFIGSFVEKLIGKKRFLSIYIIGGLFASLSFVVLAGIFGNSELGARIVGSPSTYAVGASGAIFALGGLLAILTPKLPVMVFFIIPMPMWMAMGVLMFGLWMISIGSGLPVGNTAHLGGLLIGLGYGFYLKKKYPNKTKMIGKHFSR